MEGQQQAASSRPVSLKTIFLVFLKVGALTFGGGYAMLPVIQREVTARRGWISAEDFLDLLVVSQSLPGAIALNSAIQMGMRLRGIPGGLLAALGMILPSFVIILALAAFFGTAIRDNAHVRAVFYGLRPAVVALIAAALVGLGRSMSRTWLSVALAAALLVPALLFRIHPVVVLLAGGLAGSILFRGEAA